MMIRMWSGIVLAVVLAGCVSQQELEQTQAEVDHLRLELGEVQARVHSLTRRPVSSPAPREHYCYINGQQFSQGAIISGRICELMPGGGGQLRWGYHD